MQDIYYKYFRDKVRERLSELDWTQQKLADAIGRPKQQVSNLLTGRRNPGVPMLAEFAHALKVEPGYLIRPIPEKKNGKASKKTRRRPSTVGNN